MHRHGSNGGRRRAVPRGRTLAKLLPGSPASGEKNGYGFTLTKTPGGFTGNANPKVFGESDGRTFYIDEDGIVPQNWAPTPAAATSPEVKWKEPGRHTNSTCELGLETF